MKKMLWPASFVTVWLLMLCGYQTALAQDTIQKRISYSTSILSNKPEDVNNLHLALSPVYLDANNLNIAFGYGLELTYLYKNQINFNARYQRAYLDRTEEATDADDAPGLASTGSTPSRNLDVSATYYFLKDTSLKPEPIFISREKLGGEPLDFNIDVAAKRLRLWGVRGGFIAYKSFIRDNENTIGFKGYLAGEPNSQLIDFNGAYSTMMETNTYYAGISRLDVSNLLLEVEGLGQRSRKRRAELYFDIMYAPQIVYYNMSAHGTANSIGFQEYNVNTHTPRSRFGARLGYTHWSLRAMGFGFGAEVGLRPGPAAGIVYNSYINLRASFNLSRHI